MAKTIVARATIYKVEMIQMAFYSLNPEREARPDSLRIIINA